MNELLTTPKDTSKSCVFDFPDRPSRPTPPTDGDGDPIPTYPYTPMDDWPLVPLPVPGSDPLGNGSGGDIPPVPAMPPNHWFCTYMPYDLGGAETYAGDSQYSRFEYWDVNSYPVPYVDGADAGLKGMGWNSANEITWLNGSVISYPTRGGIHSPRAILNDIFPAETGYNWSDAVLSDNPELRRIIDTGIIILETFPEMDDAYNAPNPTTYEAWFLYYARYTNYSSTYYDATNPLTWPRVAVAAVPTINLRSGSGVVIDLVNFYASRSLLMLHSGGGARNFLANEKIVVDTAHIVVAADNVPFGLKIGY